MMARAPAFERRRWVVVVALLAGAVAALPPVRAAAPDFAAAPVAPDLARTEPARPALVPVNLPPRAPVARRIPKEIVQHGEKRVDEYFWLREKENPETVKYLEAENAYTEAVMKPVQGLKERLYTELVGRIKEDDTEVPHRKGPYLYYVRTEKGKQYPIYCRRRPAPHPAPPGGAAAALAAAGAESVTIDPNQLAEGKPFFAVDQYEVSDDANLLAYTTDVTGFRQYTLYVKDLRTGKTLADTVEKVTAVEWAADNKTLFYVVEDEAKRPYRLYRHVLGTPAKDDSLVYEEGDRLFELYLDRTRSGAFLVVASVSKTTSEVRLIATDKPGDAPRLIEPRKTDREYYVDHRGGHLYIRTNDAGKNFRLVRAPVGAADAKHWEEVVPHRADVMLDGIECFEKYVVLQERADALPGLRIMRFAEAKDSAAAGTQAVRFPDPVYSCSIGPNEVYAADALRVVYQSFTTPTSAYDVNMASGALTLLKRRAVLGGYDPSKYASERIYTFPLEDGTRVPVSLVYRKDFGRGPRPLLLEGYGAYGFPQDVFFASAYLTLLDRGFCIALAHPRGGGDYGKRWHDAGRMTNKKNTFTDFIACADHLVSAGYTARDRLAISGGSAGGLLIGAVLNLRPDLCRVALLDVPFVDVLNTMSDDTLPLTTQEYIEWGNPGVKSEYEYIKSYCPYTNLRAADYPAMLVRTSLNDSQVLYHEPAKYVAKLRTLRTDRHTFLLQVNMGAGHGGASGRYDALKETAFQYAFLLREMGVAK